MSSLHFVLGRDTDNSHVGKYCRNPKANVPWKSIQELPGHFISVDFVPADIKFHDPSSMVTKCLRKLFTHWHSLIDSNKFSVMFHNCMEHDMIAKVREGEEETPSSDDDEFPKKKTKKKKTLKAAGKRKEEEGEMINGLDDIDEEEEDENGDNSRGKKKAGKPSKSKGKEREVEPPVEKKSKGNGKSTIVPKLAPSKTNNTPDTEMTDAEVELLEFLADLREYSPKFEELVNLLANVSVSLLNFRCCWRRLKTICSQVLSQSLPTSPCRPIGWTSI